VSRTYAVNAYELATWMHREGLAELRNGRLTPTRRCVELAEHLTSSG
jgi:hypothetical protein